MKEMKIYKMHDIYWGKKPVIICDMYWDVQWIPKKISKKFRCKFSADNKKEV